MKNVCACVVTYNRKELLRRCLEALIAQSVKCDRIIVIDNASDDGTEELSFEAWCEEVEWFRISRNTGGAGGFNAGMRLAYQGGANFIWIMDDDVIPEPQALKNLLEADKKLEGRGLDRPFLVSTVWTPEGEATNVPELDRRKNALHYENWQLFFDLGMLPVTRATFVSILFPSESLRDYGLPIAQMFIWGDDSEYTLRLTQKSPGFLIANSRVVHVRAAPGILDISKEKNSTRIKYHRYLTRNMFYTARKHRGIIALLGYCVKRIIVIIFLVARFRFRKAAVLIQGLIEGAFFFPKIDHADGNAAFSNATIKQIKNRASEEYMR